MADEAGDRIASQLDELAERMAALEGAGRGAEAENKGDEA
jgi:DNA-binding ferritin-like protein